MLRAPRLGMVKTRLARDLGNGAALALYQAFVLDMLDALQGCGADVAVWVEPGGEVSMAREWLGESVGRGANEDGPAREASRAHPDDRLYLPQPGGNLGEKMDHAFRWAFDQGYQAAAALGSDLPQVSAKLARNLTRLMKSEPALIGPSPDGGYWTIGFQAGSYLPEAFSGMPWSGPELFARTLAVVEPLQPAILPELADMDTLDDLRGLAATCPAGLARRTLGVVGPLLRSVQTAR
jgi:hypothetical protein